MIEEKDWDRESKGRVALPNRMNFWKGSKRQLTPTPQNGPYLWKSCACISYFPAIISDCIYATISAMKNLHYNFPKMRRAGVKGRLEFFQKIIRFGSRTLP